MKKHFFSKYIILTVTLCLAAMILLASILLIYTRGFFVSLDEEKLETAAIHINQSITTMLELTQQDFDYLLEEKKELLTSALSALNTAETEIFITDATGKVVVSEGSIKTEDRIPSSAMTESTSKARAGEIFRTDLDGFFSKERVCRVVLLEKEFPDSHKQRVGAVFIFLQNSFAQNYLFGLIRSFLAVLIFMLCALSLSFYLFSRDLARPLGRLNSASEKFARGDFSARLSEEGAGELTPLFRAFNQMAESVEENEKLRQTFVSNVSHDLRTPLTTIGGFIQNMENGVIPPEKQGYYFGIINDEVARLSRLVQTLLETSRMTAGERKYDFSPMDLPELSRITLLSFENRILSKDLDVSFECDEEEILVMADRDAIQQVLYNLIDNAIKFTPEKGRLSLFVTLQGQKAIFCVENSGDGIPEEELKQLFDRFYKSDRSRGLDKKGMGLGLFIAKSVIDAHGEEIWVESREKEFTRFYFSLPLAEK
ncbi:MAG: HAMP domain-containing histidine kinase [Clostridia bacterium]|nr:HAMP domain-containing histidine kinase [Clostridia bacterium]